MSRCVPCSHQGTQSNDCLLEIHWNITPTSLYILDVFGDKKVACLMTGSSSSFFLTTELCFREHLNLFGSPNRLFYSSSQRHNIHAFPKAIQIISPTLHHLSAFRQMHRSVIGTAVGVTYRELRPETKHTPHFPLAVRKQFHPLF